MCAETFFTNSLIINLLGKDISFIKVKHCLFLKNIDIKFYIKIEYEYEITVRRRTHLLL